MTWVSATSLSGPTTGESFGCAPQGGDGWGLSGGGHRAYYYLYSAKNADCDQLAHGPMDKVLESLQAEFQAKSLPVKSLQLDDWWYLGGPDSPLDSASHDHMCVREMKGKPKLWPKGLPTLPGLSYVLYAPFFCSDSVYAHNFTMVNSTDGHNAAPAPEDSEAFFAALFAEQRARGVPMIGYEVDFLEDQTGWFRYMIAEVDGAARWLTGMATAAAAANISVQYCMAHPASFLHALSLPAVTNGRASGDYQTPAGNLLSYGAAAPLFAALGVAPSKDNFWTTPNQPPPRNLAPSGGPPPCDGGSRNVTNNLLHALVATLSTGPVGFSDAVGHSDPELILRTCTADGLLLKPSRPLAAIDRSFSRRGGSPGVPARSHVWSTHTAAAGGNVWYYAVSLVQSGLLEPFELLRDDLWPQLSPSTAVVAWDPFGSINKAREVAAAEPIAVLQGEGHAAVAVALVMSSGWALLGEPLKLNPISEQRQFELTFDANVLTVSMAGAPGERCLVSAWRKGSVYNTVELNEHGAATFQFKVH